MSAKRGQRAAWALAAGMVLLGGCSAPPPPRPYVMGTIDRSSVVVNAPADVVTQGIKSMLEGMGMEVDARGYRYTRVDGYISARSAAHSGFQVFIDQTPSGSQVAVKMDNYRDVEMRRTILDAVLNRFP